MASRSLVYDVEQEKGLAERMAELLLRCDSWAEQALRKLIETIAERNTAKSHIEETATQLLACGAAVAGNEPPARDSALPMPWHIARAARVILAARR